MFFIKTLILISGITLSFFQSAATGPQNSSKQPQGPPTSVTTPTTAGPKESKVPDNSVGPTQPVITVHGLCATPADPASCNKVITREAFEKLMNALNPSGQAISPKGRQNLAQTYAEYLAFEKAARGAGTEDTPEFHEVMDWVRLPTIADLYRRSLQEKFRTPSPEEIDAYYKQHLASFERVKLARILVPRENVSSADKTEFDQKALAAANAARQRAAQGEEPEQIQKQVYSSLELNNPPPTDLGNYGRANFTEKEGAEVFSLKAGEVSQVEIEPKSYVIYKVISRETLPEEQVKTEISRDISQQKFKDAFKAITDSAHPDFNEQYFGPGIAAPAAIAPVLPARPPSH